MFGGGEANPYDEIVAKATDENLTSENWEIILTLCDKVADEGQKGANSAVGALIKRLAHRNPNVQLYALSLAEALTKNLGIELHRELASKAFTQALEKIITDRTTHDKVKKRALQLVAECAAEFENDTSLGIMEDLYNNLKTKGFKFESSQEPLPPSVDDDIRRKEEEELQRVLEMSMQDRGGRGGWSDYSLAGAGSSQAAAGSSSAPKPLPSTSGYTAPKYNAGYAPARTPSPATQQRYRQPDPEPQPPYAYSATPEPAAQATLPSTTAPRSPTTTANLNIVTRVRALHTFEASEQGELAFEKGDIIKVVDRGYKDWWRGQLKGRTGIFPVNYVEPMPEPTVSELAKEAEQEASVFSQAGNVERLLQMLKTMDPDKDNLADNEEIQELYRSCMSLRPKIVKLIDKYSQKRADLVTMNESFVRARTIFDRMMEESLARHTGVYEQPPYRGPQYPQQQPQGRPNARPPAQAGPAPQGYGWNPNVYEQPGYNAYPAPAGAYPVPQPQAQSQAPPQPYAQRPPVQPTPAPAAATPAPAPQPQAYGYNAPYSQQGPNPYGVPPQPQPQQPQQAQPQVQPSAPVQEPLLPSPYASHSVPIQQPALTQSPAPIGGTQPLNLRPGQVAAQQHPQQQQQSQFGGPLPQPVRQDSQPLPSPYGGPQPQVQAQQQQPPQQQTPYGGPQQQPQLHQTASTNTVPQVQAQQPQLSQTPSASTIPQVQPQQPVQQIQHVQPLQQVQPQPQAQILTQPIQEQAQAQVQAQAQSPVRQAEPQMQQPQQHQAHVEPQAQAQTQEQPQAAAQQAQPAQQQPAQAQAKVESAAAVDNGPPYVFDPARTYTDPNVQAWAQYYGQGGTDPAGAVYFVSVPGVTGAPAPAPAAAASVSASAEPAASTVQQGQVQAQQVEPQQQRQPTLATQVAGPNATRYQLTDSGFASSPQQQQPQRQMSGDVVPQQVAAQAAAPVVAAAVGDSPSATPSWVLPKKNVPR